MKAALRSHQWPDYIRDPSVPVPKRCRVKEGTLLVPTHLPLGNLAYMEQEFRSILWPPCSKDGFKRYAREFLWADEGRVLHFRIIDIPSTAPRNRYCNVATEEPAMLDFYDEVTSAVTGDKQPARVARCDCGCLYFGVFQIAGQGHFHLQCANCGVSFCLVSSRGTPTTQSTIPDGCEPESTGQRRST